MNNVLPTLNSSVNSSDSLPKKIQKVKAALDEGCAIIEFACDLFSEINFENSEYEFNYCKSLFLSNMVTTLQVFNKKILNIDVSDIDLRNQIFESAQNSRQFVYIAKQTNENNIYKIGRTKDLETREKTFQVGNIFVNLIAYRNVKDSVRAENYLHNFFSKKRIMGEWFELNELDLEILTNLFGFNFGLGE